MFPVFNTLRSAFCLLWSVFFYFFSPETNSCLCKKHNIDNDLRWIERAKSLIVVHSIQSSCQMQYILRSFTCFFFIVESLFLSGLIIEITFSNSNIPNEIHPNGSPYKTTVRGDERNNVQRKKHKTKHAQFKSGQSLQTDIGHGSAFTWRSLRRYIELFKHYLAQFTIAFDRLVPARFFFLLFIIVFHILAFTILRYWLPAMLNHACVHYDWHDWHRYVTTVGNVVKKSHWSFRMLLLCAQWRSQQWISVEQPSFDTGWDHQYSFPQFGRFQRLATLPEWEGLPKNDTQSILISVIWCRSESSSRTLCPLQNDSKQTSVGHTRKINPTN